MVYETAGDPISGCKWTAKSTEKIARELSRAGCRVSPKTVARLLKEMNFSLRVNVKMLESGQSKPIDPQIRDRQFRYIKRQRLEYARKGLPVISVDTKARELIGRFHHSGRCWSRERIDVFDHDFPSDADGVGIPYGIYDTVRNEGFVSVGISRDTACFAVDAIRSWWTKAGSTHYRHADAILILADCGGSNSYRTRLWKYQLQTDLCNRSALRVKVCHYPPGTSKWNPIEHRLFPFVSANWAAQPLVSYEAMLKRIRATRTETGLRVRALLNNKEYQTGIKVSDAQMQQIALTPARVHPQWNYSIAPA